MLVTVRILLASALRRIGAVKLSGNGIVGRSSLSTSPIITITLLMAAVILRILVIIFLIFY